MINMRQAYAALRAAGVVGRNSFERSSAAEPTMPRTAAAICARSSTSDRTPAASRMFSYLPPALADNRALVVVLHGCTQTARLRSRADGRRSRTVMALRWCCRNSSGPTIPTAASIGFSPRTASATEGRLFDPADGRKMRHDNGIDRRRVFVTGLSAGGAMASTMLACYPGVFAGGAIVAGLPYGAAKNVQQAFESMFQSPARPAREWGDLVRSGSPHRGPWPRVSVWHGNADKTVIPSNAREILKQWTDVHGLPLSPSARATVDGYPREVWLDEAGNEIIESYTITDMAHGTPLATHEAEGACGAAGPFLLQVGISSSYHIAKFFGLAVAGRLRRGTW